MISIKRHRCDTGSILAVCDSELIGKKFSENGKALSVSEHFFKGEIVNDEKAVEEMNSAMSLNIVGKEAIEIAIDAGLIKVQDVYEIQGIPYAIIFEIADSQ